MPRTPEQIGQLAHAIYTALCAEKFEYEELRSFGEGIYAQATIDKVSKRAVMKLWKAAAALDAKFPLPEPVAVPTPLTFQVQAPVVSPSGPTVSAAPTAPNVLPATTTISASPTMSGLAHSPVILEAEIVPPSVVHERHAVDVAPSNGVHVAESTSPGPAGEPGAAGPEGAS